MSIDFLTPLGALLAVGAVLTLAAFAIAQKRAQRVAKALRLPPPSRGASLSLGIALAAIPVLLGIAAAQPVLETTDQRLVRSDAEAIFILDTSRSMLASASAGSPTRFERAQHDAIEVRRALAGVPVGLASLTNRLLPHLFPSSDATVFANTLNKSIGIERPPPNRTGSNQITNFAPLANLLRLHYFGANAEERLAVVFTDGETTFKSNDRLRRTLLRPPGIDVIFVHVADADERVYGESGFAEPAYRADPQSMAKLDTMARIVRGRAYDESQLADVEQAARAALGRGVSVARGTERRAHPLAPYVALAGLLPLGLILRRRNL